MMDVIPFVCLEMVMQSNSNYTWESQNCVPQRFGSAQRDETFLFGNETKWNHEMKFQRISKTDSIEELSSGVSKEWLSISHQTSDSTMFRANFELFFPGFEIHEMNTKYVYVSLTYSLYYCRWIMSRWWKWQSIVDQSITSFLLFSNLQNKNQIEAIVLDSEL